MIMNQRDLQDIISYGILDTDRVLHELSMKRYSKVLEVHPFVITPPVKGGGRWQTYVRDGSGRKIIRASTEENLFQKLYDFYYANRHVDNLTLKSLFPEWLEYKESITSSSNTIRRHEQHWKKYFSDLPLVNVRLSNLDLLELQKSCNLLIKQSNLSSKEWQNIKTILIGMFDYAFQKGWIKSNFMRDVKITVRFRQVNKKSGSTQTYQTEEYNALMEYLSKEYTETGNIAVLAVRFNFMLGLRVGELVALKWSDIKDLNHVQITREEIKESSRTPDGWVDCYKVVEHTKTHSDRVVMLVPKAMAILNEIRLRAVCGLSDDGYVFVNDGERITARQVAYVLEKACNKLGIPVKSTHKIRKTVASRLSAGGVPVDSIRETLGHSNLQTTLGYIYNPLTEKETYTLMSKVL